MGAEFLLYSLPWTQLDEARQKELHDTIDRLTDEQLENLVEAIGAFEEEDLSEVRTAIHEAVDEYLDLDDCRDATTWRCGSEPITRVFTGGLSWGDAPTECCQNFNIIANCEPIFDLIERWAREDSPASAADTSQPFDILDDVTAALETCLAHFGKQMPPDDRVQRERLAASARTLLRSQSNMPSPTGEVDAQVPSSLRNILQEFCRDVEAAGRDQVAEDWPDLVITYDRAKVALSRPV